MATEITTQLQVSQIATQLVVNGSLTQLTPGARIDTTVALGVPSSSGDRHYRHDQMVPSDTWAINHGLGKFPSVTVVDSSGSEVEGAVQHTDAYACTVSFSAGFAGVAYCN